MGHAERSPICSESGALLTSVAFEAGMKVPFIAIIDLL